MCSEDFYLAFLKPLLKHNQIKTFEIELNLEFPLVLECKLLHIAEIGLHIQFIGEIMDVKAEENVIGENGLPTADKVNPFLFSPTEHKYYSIGKFLEKSHSIGLKLRK